MEDPFKNDRHHIDMYKSFAEEWHISDLESLVKYYDIYELRTFLPETPTQAEKQTLGDLIGVTTPSGYMDYQKSNNTFELIMQWREKTGNLQKDKTFLNRD